MVCALKICFSKLFLTGNIILDRKSHALMAQKHFESRRDSFIFPVMIQGRMRLWRRLAVFPFENEQLSSFLTADSNHWKEDQKIFQSDYEGEDGSPSKLNGKITDGDGCWKQGKREEYKGKTKKNFHWCGKILLWVKKKKNTQCCCGFFFYFSV